eukprot:TRINITY_DN24878_c0_g1_i1.p1 TRINITY_DN24878_c0_g1~~TRINITY_DN24878_c0_g1_i1.p1  ORF type:complete len:373 (-),score=51.88 TRINITY_DN24878_c0_g1_i1:243-1247(-)
MTSCSRSLWAFSRDADHIVWRRAFMVASQGTFVPRLATSPSSMSSWRSLLRGRIPPAVSHCVTSYPLRSKAWQGTDGDACRHLRVRVVPESELQPGDQIDWFATVAVIGEDGPCKKGIINGLVNYDEVMAGRRSSLVRQTRLLRSCVVDAFQTRGRLVFADFDSGGLDLPNRPRGGIENVDAAVFVCDAEEGASNAVAAVQLIRRADAIVAESNSASCQRRTRQEGGMLRLLALTTHRSEMLPSNRITSMMEDLQIADGVEDLQCEVVPASAVHNGAGVAHLLQLLVWGLLEQNTFRRQRLQAGAHTLIDSGLSSWYDKRDSAPTRRSRSQGVH